MTRLRFSNQYPSLFDPFFENDSFDWSGLKYSNTNTTLPYVNIKESNDDSEVVVPSPGFTKMNNLITYGK